MVKYIKKKWWAFLWYGLLILCFILFEIFDVGNGKAQEFIGFLLLISLGMWIDFRPRQKSKKMDEMLNESASDGQTKQN